MPKKTRQPAFRLTTLLIAMWVFCLSPPTFANNLGIDWLANQAQPSGDYSNTDDMATPFMATAETLLSFYQLGETETAQPSMTNALNFVNTDLSASTDDVCQVLKINARAGRPVDPFISELVKRLKDNGGFGDLVDDFSAVINTARALDALAMTSIVETNLAVLYPTIDFLLKQQQSNGGWADNDNETSVYLTALVMPALWHYRHHLSNIPSLNVVPALDKAQAYLLAQRNENGLWNDTFESALALIAILPRLTEGEEMSASVEALRAVQLVNGSWEKDVYTTALALRALHIADSPQQNPDLGQIIGVVIDGQTNTPLAGLPVLLSENNTQLTDKQGKFQFTDLEAGDYTIQIGQAEQMMLKTPLQPAQIIDLGLIRFFPETGATAIQGTVTEATTDEPLAGVEILITGVDEAILTDEQGAYRIGNLEPGEVMIQASLEGYVTASLMGTVATGMTLVASLALSPDTVTLEGVVTDGSFDGVVLAGATILIDGTPTTLTAADGSYRVEGLPSGEHSIRIEFDGYDSVDSFVTIPTQTTLIFSPQLYLTGSTPPIEDNASVLGIVVDKTTGMPIEGVLVTNGTETVTTDSAGQFHLINLAAVPTTLSWQMTGYLDKTMRLTLSAFTQLDLGEIVLTPEGYLMQVGVRGIVMDASNNQALADVSIEAQFGETEQSLTSAADGTFDVTGQVEDELLGQLSFTIEGYVPFTLDVLLVENEILDLGQVRLRPEEVTVLLPDLVIEQVDSTEIQTDPQTNAVFGMVTAHISNAGTTPTDSDIALLAFYDVDLNSVYDTDIDVSLGESVIDNALAVAEEVTVDIAVVGELPFRDAPIQVWVDNVQAVVESDEGNNVEATSGKCRIVPTPLPQQSLKLKWHWDKGDVLGPPAVGQLSDDNGDGKIDSNDIPDLVFSAFRSNSTKGTLYIVSGEDGRELWSGSDVIRHGSVALGDIDGDNIVEIIVPLSDKHSDFSSELAAFKHDGTLLFQVAIGEYSLASGVAIADLEHDGLPEIIYGRHVFEHDGSSRWTGKGDKATANHWGYNYGYNSLAADVDLDGIMEVVAGRTLYEGINGKIKWHQSHAASDGYNAVGNFDEDNFAEIVLVANGQVYLISHNGEIKWGPVSLPGGGKGGPPTIADVDNDGQPEIGVAGRSFYTVFETNGSIKWSSEKTQDPSSNATGSSVFDFEADGKVEVLYADEVNFYIYA